MFERPNSGEKSLLVQVSVVDLLTDSDLAEFVELSKSAGASVFDSIHVIRKIAEPKYLIGEGKVLELESIINENEIELVVFNADLSPSQERNLESLLKCRVLDRTGLILDIFAQRARSHEGKLQVELAQLKHLSTRLIRGWTHLERQKGGIGLRGPGETQLETDRRLLADRIKQINLRLKKVSAQRNLVQSGRKRKNLPLVSLVGYTNAGKSSLFNRLTGAHVYAEDKLFATLDTTLRRLNHEGSDQVILTDTVGFVNKLPHELVAAFKSTLQETVNANLLLHVIDSADAEHRVREDIVDSILKEIGAEDIPVIRVYNKIDLTDHNSMVIKQDDSVSAIFLSSLTGEGVDLLSKAVLTYFYGESVTKTLKISTTAAKLRAKLYDENAVLSEVFDEQGNMILSIKLSDKRYQILSEQFVEDWQEL